MTVDVLRHRHARPTVTCNIAIIVTGATPAKAVIASDRLKRRGGLYRKWIATVRPLARSHLAMTRYALSHCNAPTHRQPPSLRYNLTKEGCRHCERRRRRKCLAAIHFHERRSRKNIDPPRQQPAERRLSADQSALKCWFFKIIALYLFMQIRAFYIKKP
jgi:hypothetical protein